MTLPDREPSICEDTQQLHNSYSSLALLHHKPRHWYSTSNTVQSNVDLLLVHLQPSWTPSQISPDTDPALPRSPRTSRFISEGRESVHGSQLPSLSSSPLRRYPLPTLLVHQPRRRTMIKHTYQAAYSDPRCSTIMQPFWLHHTPPLNPGCIHPGLPRCKAIPPPAR